MTHTTSFHRLTSTSSIDQEVRRSAYLGQLCSAALTATFVSPALIPTVTASVVPRVSYQSVGRTIDTAPVDFEEHTSLGFNHGSSADYLEEHGLKADRRESTEDGHLLLEYFRKFRGGVDFHPSGEIIVIIENNGIDDIYEFDSFELKQIAVLLRDAGA